MIVSNQNITNIIGSYIKTKINSSGPKGAVGATGPIGPIGPTGPVKTDLPLTQFQGLPTNKMETILVPNIPVGQFNWAGGVLAPNGKIYGIPWLANSVLIFDPNTENIDTTSIIIPNNLLPGPNLPGWAGGVLAPNGKIYCCPEQANNVLIIDPDTNSVSSISGVIDRSWYGCVLYSNGKIYCVPYGATNVLIIDTNNDTINETEIQGLNNGVDIYGSSHKWAGGAFATNGKIYMVPMLENRILIVDPLSSITNLSGTFASATYTEATKTLQCPGATFLTSLSVGDNVIITTTTNSYTGYVNSITSDTIVEFIYYLGGTLATPVNLLAGDINNLQKTRKADITTISGLSGDWRNVGCVLAPNGKIYSVPHDNNWVTVIDTSNNTTTQISVPISFYGNNYRGGSLAPNGKIYCVPSNRQDVLVIDPTNDTTSFINNIVLPSGNYKYNGSVLAPNGNVYGIPWNTQSILKISTGLPTLPSYMLEAYFNKL
jgi:hypothetical protein